MKNEKSGTAEGVAFMRYYESQKPENERICNDYMAYNLSAWWVKASAIICSIFTTSFMDRALEKKDEGFYGFIAVRTWLFDDNVLERIKNGARQYVILGAGLDSRAYRFAEKLADVKVFEVDHPPSQATKKKRVEKYLGTMPVHVRYVPIDFTKGRLLQLLKDAGYDPSLKTVFTFEGVTMYLDASSVKETLLFVLNNSGPGSSIMLDYIYKEVLDGKMKSKVISRMNKLKSLLNEPVIFGIGINEAERFIRGVGFDKVVEYSPRRLHEIYMKPTMTGRTISDNFAIALAYKT
jgi:methyltransferase (TIGR00027 family)